MSTENVVVEREPFTEPFTQEEIDAMDLAALKEGLEELMEELPMEEEEDDEEEKEERWDWRMYAREALWDLLCHIGGPPPEEEEEEEEG